MSQSLDCLAVDGCLVRLLNLLEAKEPYGTVASEVRRFIDTHTPAIFLPEWEKDWKTGAFARGEVPFCNTRILSVPSETLDTGQKNALTVACESMIRLLLDSGTGFHKDKHQAALADALREYLALRGYEVTGNAGSATPADNTEQGDREAVFRQLEPVVRKAYLACQYAETLNERKLEDREAYEWLKENGIDPDKGDLGELADYEPPNSFDTFRRYLTTARKPLGESKYTQRGGRKHGGSIAQGNAIEYQKGDEK